MLSPEDDQLNDPNLLVTTKDAYDYDKTLKKQHDRRNLSNKRLSHDSNNAALGDQTLKADEILIMP